MAAGPGRGVAYHRGARFRAGHRRIDFQIIDTQGVASRCHKRTGRGTGAPAGLPVSQPMVRHRSMMISIGQRTPTNKIGKPTQPSRAAREDPPRDGKGTVVADVHHDIQPHAAVGGDRLIKRAIQDRNEWLDVLAFAARSQSHPRRIAGGGHLHKPINPRFIHTPSNVSWITATMLDFRIETYNSE